MTWNIRYDNKEDGINQWENRKERLASEIKSLNPDLFGIQEGLINQVSFLKNTLNQYNYYGIGRDDGQEKGEYSAIFFRASTYHLKDSGTFWLSETPDLPSKGWDAALPRIVTWVKLEMKATGRVFYVFNTHFDHEGEQARVESARLCLRKIDEITPRAPFLLMGDFNFEDSNEAYDVLTKNGSILVDTRFASRKKPAGPKGTFSGFEPGYFPGKRIDYIFVHANVKVKEYSVIAKEVEGRYASDHLPVIIIVSF